MSPKPIPQCPVYPNLQDWHFDGGDIIYLIRAGYRGANTYHNSNRVLYSRVKQWQLHLAPQNDASPAATRAAGLATSPASPDGATPSHKHVSKGDEHKEQQRRHSPRHGICGGHVSVLPCSSAAEGSPPGAARDLWEGFRAFGAVPQQLEPLQPAEFSFGAWVCITGGGGCRRESP